MEKNNNRFALLSKLGGFLNALVGEKETIPRASEEPSPIREDMERRLRAAGRPLPTNDQWQMILARSATTRVVAGAGSGKSTTLVLRVIKMAFYDGIPWQSIRVVTFTRNSRADFIEKLVGTAKHWGYSLSDRDASAVVRTFHSLVFAQAKAAGLNVKTLDQLDGGSGGGGAAAPFPTLSVDADSELARTLNEAASALMTTDPSFAEVVAALYTHSFIESGGMHLDPSKEGRLLAVRQHDAARTQFMEQLWRSSIAPSLMADPLISFRCDTFATGPLEIGGKAVQAHGPWWGNAYIPKLNAWLLLGATERHARGHKMPDGFAIGPALGAKKSCVNVLTSNQNVIWVNTPDDLAALLVRLKWRAASDEAFPKFGVKLTGEVGATPLLVALWQQAQFLQSLGIDVAQAASASVSKVQGIDALFAKALAIFWPAFTRLVAEKGYTLSNQLFLDLTDPKRLQELPDEAILGVQHLLADEFQDISGIIVNWLKAVRAEISRRGHTTSLMVVGDDWQSIYGWRGASPKYFTEFFRRFDAAPDSQETVHLSENFRSSQRIVDAASTALECVKEKIDKQSVAKGKYADVDVPVTFARLGESVGPDVQEAREFLARDSVFVIGRTRSSLVPFKSSGATCLTIHGSKGLEADYVLLVDDFAAPATHPLRTCWYERAGLGHYGHSQDDETMRLAYVAITRAKKGCRWLVGNQNGSGTFARLLQSGSPSIQLLEASSV